jgi:hypothetical protein
LRATVDSIRNGRYGKADAIVRPAFQPGRALSTVADAMKNDNAAKLRANKALQQQPVVAFSAGAQE